MHYIGLSYLGAETFAGIEETFAFLTLFLLFLQNYFIETVFYAKLKIQINAKVFQIEKEKKRKSPIELLHFNLYFFSSKHTALFWRLSDVHNVQKR